MSGYGRRGTLLAAASLFGTMFALGPARPFPRLQPGPLRSPASEAALSEGTLAARGDARAAVSGAFSDEDADSGWRDAPADAAARPSPVRPAPPAPRLRPSRLSASRRGASPSGAQRARAARPASRPDAAAPGRGPAARAGAGRPGPSVAPARGASAPAAARAPDGAPLATDAAWGRSSPALEPERTLREAARRDASRRAGARDGRTSARRRSLFDAGAEEELFRQREPRTHRHPPRRGGGGKNGAERERRARRRFHPLLLSSLLGRKPLHPPPLDLEPPGGLLSLPGRRPDLEPSGAPTPEEIAGLGSIETLDPRSLPADRHAGPHWDGDRWHDGGARGLVENGAWLWLYRDGARWWALAGRPSAPLLRHEGAWWLKDKGLWFVVHEGEPWVWRSFADWGGRGLFHPGTGTQIVYSADYSRVAVITPGEGAAIFDARTGAELGSIPEERMPPKRRPKVPSSISFPRGG